MHLGPIMLAVFEPLPQWVNFLVMLGGVFFAGAIGVLVWFLFLRKRKKRKYRQHHREKRRPNPTLSQSGGLPPKRDLHEPPPES
jgi:hypothetical protein